jgi:hypothetical protein
MNTNKTFTVIYWTGGTVAGEWHKCPPVATFAEADKMIEDIRRGGRVAWWLPEGMDVPGGPPSAEDFGPLDRMVRRVGV